MSDSSSSSPPDHKNMAPPDFPEEAVGSISSDENCHAVMKGKRTKRKRVQAQSSPPASSSSPASSSAEHSCTTTTVEEEDMANCLILLAQGRALGTSTAASASNSHLYECKTCNKCFPSFQALGGHRASHKKPKVGSAEAYAFTASAAAPLPNSASTDAGTDMAGGGGIKSSKGRVHECSICGSEFSSGQALGGHMRRHRPIASVVSEQAHEEGEEKRKKQKERSLLSLDLNLPAPPEDDRAVLPSSTTFVLGKAQAPLLFSAWVDCHY